MPSVSAAVKKTSTVETQTDVIDVRTTETQTVRNCNYMATQTNEVFRQTSHCQTEDVPTQSIATDIDDAQMFDELMGLKQGRPEVMIHPSILSPNNSSIVEWEDQASPTSLDEIEIITVSQILTPKQETDIEITAAYGTTDYGEFYEEEYLTVVENESVLSVQTNEDDREDLDVEEKKLVMGRYELLEVDDPPEPEYIQPHITPSKRKQCFFEIQGDLDEIKRRKLATEQTNKMIAKIDASVLTYFCPLCQIKLKGMKRLQTLISEPD
jgi:hypothetical protein